MAEDKKFSKTDMERVALFKELGYVTIGDTYHDPSSGNFNQSASKGKQMLPGGPKQKSALPAGYFDSSFSRVFDGESYSDPIKMRRMQRKQDAERNIGKPFLPSIGEKKPCGSGNYYGTLSGPVEAFSAANRTGASYKAPGKNFYTNPGKKGTGFGYVNVTIGGYFPYKADEYDRNKELSIKEHDRNKKSMKGGAFRLSMHPRAYFDENPYRGDAAVTSGGKRRASSVGHKKASDVKPFKPSSPGKEPGGMKAGTFDSYPDHSVDLYKERREYYVNVVNKNGKSFIPNPGLKSAPVNSIVNQNVHRSLNTQNYHTVTSVMAY